MSPWSSVFFIETVQGEGGLNVAGIRWLRELAALAKRIGPASAGGGKLPACPTVRSGPMTNTSCDLTDLAECLAKILHDNRFAVSLMDPAEPSECAVLARQLTEELDHEGWSVSRTLSGEFSMVGTS